ncbi:MAG: hypothetical protein CM15mL5_2180 [uncultured marine virus]|nr:MAG: hypothetical protein CM15mL5_2180 [uncultured marine virus]
MSNNMTSRDKLILSLHLFGLTLGSCLVLKLLDTVIAESSANIAIWVFK